MRYRGHKKAVVAVAHSLLRTIYHVLAEPMDYREPGAEYYDRRHAAPTTHRAVAQLGASWLPRHARARSMSATSIRSGIS
jgi:hypothetical protein